MTGNIPWLEKIDSLLKILLRQGALRLSQVEVGESLGSRWYRMETLRLLLKGAMEAEEKALRYLTRADFRELTWAYAQFSNFDYQLIKLAYGRTAQHIYILRYSRIMQRQLDSYLVRTDEVALERFFETARAAEDDSGEESPEEVKAILKVYGEELQEVWLYHLLRKDA